MKVIRLIYFHIYNTYSKDGSYTNDIPHLTAFGLVWSAVSMILISILFSAYKLLFEAPLTLAMVEITLVCFLVWLFFVLLYKGKYNDVYNEFKDSKWDTLPLKLLSWSSLIVGFIMIGAVVYIFNPPK